MNIKMYEYYLQELQPIPALPLSQQRGQGRIVGGEEASDGEFPFQARAEIFLKLKIDFRTNLFHSFSSYLQSF